MRTGYCWKLTRTNTLLMVLVVAPFATWCRAESGDDTLRYYLSKSQLVVIGTIENEPTAQFGEDSVPIYRFNFKVSEVLKGEWDKSKVLSPAVARFEQNEKDSVPCLLRKGGTCVLFLRSAPPNSLPAWESVDPWFGIQHAGPMMARSLKRLMKDGGSK